MASPFQSYLTLSKWIFVEEKVAVVRHSKMKREREKERERVIEVALNTRNSHRYGKED